MLQRDYLMQLLAQFIQAILNSRKTSITNPKAAADSLEAAIANATDIDGAFLLTLGGESMAQVMLASGVDPRIAGYIAHSLNQEAEYLDAAGEQTLASLRREQAQCLEQTFALDMPAVAEEIEEHF